MATNPKSLLKAEVVDHLGPIVSMFHSARTHIEKSEPSDRSSNQDRATGASSWTGRENLTLFFLQIKERNSSRNKKKTVSDAFKGVPVQIPFIKALIYSRFGYSVHSCSEQSTELLVTFISFCWQLHQISRPSITVIEAVLKIKLLQLTARDVLYMISIHPVPLTPSNTGVVSICKSVYLWITQNRRWTWTMPRPLKSGWLINGP